MARTFSLQPSVFNLQDIDPGLGYWTLGVLRFNPVQGSRFRGWGLGRFGVQGSGIRGLGFREVRGSGFRVQGSGIRGLGFREVRGSGFRVQGSGIRGLGFREVRGSGFGEVPGVLNIEYRTPNN